MVGYLVIFCFEKLFKFLGAGAVEDCLPCPGGYYCDQEAQTGPTGLCDAGYYCPANDTTISPTPSGLMCPVGYYCPQGSAEAIPCPPGEYQDNVGQSSCIACPAGFYCTVDPVTSTPSLIDCPAYHYCPLGLYYQGTSFIWKRVYDCQIEVYVAMIYNDNVFAVQEKVNSYLFIWYFVQKAVLILRSAFSFW